MVSFRVDGLLSSTLIGSCGMQRIAESWTMQFGLKSVSKCLDPCARMETLSVRSSQLSELRN